MPGNDRLTRRSRTLVGHTVLAIARHAAGAAEPPTLTGLSSADRAAVIAAARVHRIAGLLPQPATAAGWPAPELAELDRTRRFQMAHHLMAGHELLRVGRMLDGTAVPWLTFKGPVLAEVLWPRPGLRSYGDIDVLLAPAHLRAALSALHETGATLLGEDWPELERTERAQLNLALPSGQVLDLHWALFNNPGVRAAFPVDVDATLARRRTVGLSGVEVNTLAPADTVVHLAAHMAQSGGSLLVWTLDLHFAVVAVTGDWDPVVATAREWGLGLVTACMLARSRRLLGTAVPDEVLDSLSGARSWRAAIGALDRVRPPHRTTGRLGTGRLLITSTRDTGVSSAAQLRRTLTGEALVPALRNREHPWRRALRRDHTRVSGQIECRSLVPSSTQDSFLDYVARSSPKGSGTE